MIFAIYRRACWFLLCIFMRGIFLYLKFCLPLIIRWIFKILFFRLSKAHFIQKKWLLVNRTTMWASMRVSMELFSSSSARPRPSVIRGNKNHIFLSTNIVIIYDSFFFVCLGGNWIFFHHLRVSLQKIEFFAFSWNWHPSILYKKSFPHCI